ncbi:MAG TPA: hypothetical protein VK524_07295 [Polyangiaceae bacterium]|nr:hypothetical protein [Polyangiaceae bacterium]
MRRSWWRVAVAALGMLPCVAVAQPNARGELPAARRLDAGDAGHKVSDPAREVAAEVLILHATNSKKGVDERIGRMPELKKPPFSAYDSYELLSKNRLPLKKEPQTLKLPNGRVLQTKLLDVLPKDYLRISASINQPGGKDFLPLLEVKAKVGQAFIVAGQSYKNGILVLVIRVVK